MTDKVPTEDIEEIVGIKRHPTIHYGKAISDTAVFFILHSQRCFNSTPDLRKCEFSLALDNGVQFPVEDETLVLGIHVEYLVGFKE
jgi:hypothetical protein